MNNIERISNALDAYTGDMDSLNATTAVFIEELGEEWPQVIYQVLGDIPLERRERLDHAFNYYAAVTAWNEIQSYLTSAQPLNRVEVMERIPVLQHWLSFFGEPGQTAVTQLQEKLSTPISEEERSLINETARWGRPQEAEIAQTITQSDLQKAIQNNEQQLSKDSVFECTENDEFSTQPEETIATDTTLIEDSTSNYDFENTATVTDKTNQTTVMATDTPPQMPHNPIDTPVTGEEINSSDIADPLVFSDSTAIQTPQESIESILEDPSVLKEPTISDSAEFIAVEQKGIESDTPVIDPNLPSPLTASALTGFDTPENPFLNTSELSESEWLIERTLRQIRLLQQIQTWLAARCVHLGNIEIFSYKYYGFVVDFYRVLLKDIHTILSDSSLFALLEERMNGGLKYLQDTQLYLEQEIRSAEENSESDVTPLIADDLDMALFKKTLGVVDQSNEKEYLGPAPDGFEIIEDPYEAMQKQKQDQYKHLEETVSDTETSLKDQIESSEHVKNTSQTSENSVQSKMSFSFVRKKPTEGTGQN